MDQREKQDYKSDVSQKAGIEIVVSCIVVLVMQFTFSFSFSFTRNIDLLLVLVLLEIVIYF